MVKLPNLLSEFLVTTSRGETRVEITSKDIVEELRRISIIGKGFIFAILTVGLGAGAVFLRVHQFDAESLWALIGATLLFLWLLLSLRKT
jgi:hypothetical protein